MTRMLKLIPTLALLLATSPVIAGETIRLSEPVEVTAGSEVFGAPLEDKSAGLSLKQLLAEQDALDGEQVRVTTRIARVCQKKGCFFIASEGALSARVSFADYSFFVPTDSGGKEVTLVGTFSRQSLDAAQAAHFAQDLGETPPTGDEPVMEYAIVATSVIIPKG